MKFLILTFCTFFCLLGTVHAQFYSGKFFSQPALEGFDHFVIHQHPHHQKLGGDLEVKAFMKSGAIWKVKADLLRENEAQDVVDRFGKGLEILSVYELMIELDGAIWEYYLLGHQGSHTKGDFIVVEEIFNDINDAPLEVNSFSLNRR